MKETVAPMLSVPIDHLFLFFFFFFFPFLLFFSTHLTPLFSV